MASKENSSEVIRILLIGRTGQGKSSTGNSLVGLKGFFKESAAAKSETTTCKWSQVRIVLGRKVEVVDTPGMFDTELDDDNAKTHKELLKSLVLTMPGFHAIAYVLKCGEKITDEFKKTQDLFFQWFGPGVENFTFIILTCCNSDKMKTDYISKNPQRKLKELVEKCGNRVSIIENKGKPYLKNEQIQLIYEAVDRIKAANGNRCFTNLIYQLAQAYFQNKRPLKFSNDSIILLQKAGLKQETQDWLAQIDRNLSENVSQPTSETSEHVPLSADEPQVTCGNLPIYDATTNERIPNTSRITKRSLPNKDIDEEEKMSDFANENSPTNDKTSKGKTSERKDRKFDNEGTESLKQAEPAKSNNDSDRGTDTDVDTKKRVNNNDNVLTGLSGYLQKARDFIKVKTGCIIL